MRVTTEDSYFVSDSSPDLPTERETFPQRQGVGLLDWKNLSLIMVIHKVLADGEEYTKSGHRGGVFKLKVNITQMPRKMSIRNEIVCLVYSTMWYVLVT